MPSAPKRRTQLPTEAQLSARESAQIGERLKSLRGKRPLRDLGESARLSPSTINQIELGKRQPKLGTMLALCQALGLHSIEELIGPLPSQTLRPSGEKGPSATP
jgi:transcriptional regulator with XRE-family HTH domain